MAHPQHAIPIVLPDGEIRAVVRAPVVERLSWALYDFSNTIFSMNVATLYFAVWLVSDLGVSNTMDAVASADRVRARRRLDPVSRRAVGRAAPAKAVGRRIHGPVVRRRARSMGVFGQRLLPLTGEAVDTPGSRFRPDGTRAARRCSGCSRRSSSRTSPIRRRSRSTTR